MVILVKVSVIVPVYNTEKYLEECLDSIVNQTLEDIEIICINDGSTDDSINILENYAKKDNRIKIFSQQNSGLSVSRNNGLELANGKYVYFIDSDDYIELTALEELYSIAEEKDLDMIIFKLINFNDGSDEKFTTEDYEMRPLCHLDGKVFNYKDIGDGALIFMVSAPGKFFKRSLIKNIRFPEDLIFEDNLFFAEAMLEAERVSFLDKHLYNRRIRESSITTTNTIKFADSITMVNLVIDLAKKYNVYEEFRYGLAIKKINMENFRYSLVGDEYKEEFFSRLKSDFKDYEEEYEEHVLDRLDENLRYIFTSVLSSSDHEEFDLKMELFEIKENLNALKKQNKKLKKLNKKLKDENQRLLSSRSWKITKPMRNVTGLFKK